MANAVSVFLAVIDKLPDQVRTEADPARSLGHDCRMRGPRSNSTADGQVSMRCSIAECRRQAAKYVAHRCRAGKFHSARRCRRNDPPAYFLCTGLGVTIGAPAFCKSPALQPKTRTAFEPQTKRVPGARLKF